jgi:outer membrane protein OmpA-like peptidoglycan-associated protein
MAISFSIFAAGGASAQVEIETAPGRSLELEAYAAVPLETEPVELAALRLLALARQDLSEDRIEPARRALEMLVARYPDSGSATPARRELLRLYSADAEITARTGHPPTAHTAAARPRILERPEQRTDAAQGWRTEVTSFRRLQHEFRNTIGDRVFFGPGSDDLGSRARAVLATQARWLKERPQVEIVVEGHADDVAAGADNELISAGRARAVRDRLVAEGVDAARIAMTAKGSSDRVALCADSDCAAQNRRVVIAVRLPGGAELGTGTSGSAVERSPVAAERQ